MEEKDWDPEDEVDIDKTQKEMLLLAKAAFAELKSKKAGRDKELEELRGELGTACRVASFPAYAPPTFEQVSANMKRAWEEVKKIAPDAPEFVQTEIFRALANVPMKDAGENVSPQVV